ncbi:hypothetical protein PRK78_006863 [Emydomyces testavorans]|uniref:SCP domain-containing protein n=1 Tax=Emydomyces testavorans TaxID=2070801 RepID=A0AAF0DNA8_9EURO|nr:hypothetical protein PRK78_006863 [Emydomyces testavorans]
MTSSSTPFMLICLLLQAAWIELSETASSQYTSDEDFKAAVLNASNDVRSQHNASALTWNNTLSAYGSDWAKQCRWKHSGATSGENLATGYPNVTAAIAAWAAERKDYHFDHPNFGHDTAHFTQLVWKSTVSVGCGRFDCGSADPGHQHPDGHSDEKRATGWYIVCEYFPRGNVIGGNLFRENVQGGQYVATGGAARTNGHGYQCWVWIMAMAAVAIGVVGIT